MADEAQTGRILGEWISRDDLAEQLEVATITLSRWACEGNGPAHIRVGRRVFYRRAAVDAWLRSMERNGK